MQVHLVSHFCTPSNGGILGLMDTNITITCNKCARHFVINTEDFDVKIIGALQVRCKNCHQVKTLPDNDQIWGLKQGEETENQIARLL